MIFVGMGRRRERVGKISAGARPGLRLRSSLSSTCFYHHQESTKTPTPALSPTLNLVTSAPTAEITPTISWPGTMGYLLSPHSPLIWCCGDSQEVVGWVWSSFHRHAVYDRTDRFHIRTRSEWQMPQYLMSTFTSLGPRARRSNSNLLNFPVVSWNQVA